MDSESPTAILPVAVVAGKYKLSRMLGRGGMGSVWEGVHTTLGTRVAVKFIDAEHAESAEARHRFENEARAAATLRSKHVVEVYDHGLMDDGRPFIVMEFLEGEPLDKRLERVGRLPAQDTARLVSMVCRALSKAHAAGIVHRDLKPDNIFLVWDDEDGSDVAKVVDFGIAKFTDSQAPTSATRTGSVLGTPYYMSPEQARGLRSVDFRSDLWSVGVITFRCMTGHLPFEGEAVGDVLVKLCTAALPVPSQYASDLPAGFDSWFARALSRDPGGRFQSASELGTSLAAVCGLSVRTSLPGDGLGGSSPHIHVRVAPATTPFGATTPSPSHGSAPQITGAPFTQTPPPGRTKSPRSNWLVSAAALFGVLVIGAGVLFKLFGGEPTAAHEVPPVGMSPASKTPEPIERPAEAAVATELVRPPGMASAAPVASSTSEASAVPSSTTSVSPTPPRKPARAKPVSRTTSKAKPQASSKPLVGKPAADIGF